MQTADIPIFAEEAGRISRRGAEFAEGEQGKAFISVFMTLQRLRVSA
jgi:hypothetical protein